MGKKQLHEPITYFDVIDTEYKAYILGFIYADGNINDKIKGKREWSLTITLQKEDSYILNKLMEDTGVNEVKIQHPPNVKKNNWKERATARIGNTYMCNQIVSLGCPPRKSTEGMTFPKLNDDMIPHFIRGFFDGDGSICIKKKIYKGKTVISNYFRKNIAFCSTDSIFLDTLFSYLPITKVYKTGRQRNMFVHIYWIERKNDIDNMYNYLYKDANFYLSRKYNKFNMSIKSQVVSRLTEGLETT